MECSQAGDVTLVWSVGTDLDLAQHFLTLTDVETGTSVDMWAASQYVFPASAGLRQFRIQLQTGRSAPPIAHDQSVTTPEDTASLMRKLPSMVSRIKLWNVAHVNGRLAEHYIGNAYGLWRNNAAIPSGRIPDFLSSGLMREIKNVIRLKWTAQLADLADHCVATGRKFYIHVRPATDVAAKVETELLARFGPGSKGVLWDIITDVPEALRVIP